MVTTGSREVSELMSRFGHEALAVSPMPVGRVNQHWRVETEAGDFVLRRYRAERTSAAIDWEHALLGHAAARGWPVAQALEAAPGAETLIESEGTFHALFPLLEGDILDPVTAAQHHIHGRLLARLHRDLVSFEAAQRPEFGRAWELDVFVRAAGEESFNGLLARFTAEHPELGRAIRAERYRNLRELARLGYGDLPDTVVHADFQSANLLYSGGTLSGVLDFDLARRDAAVFDIACSVTFGCLEAPALDAIDIDPARAFIEGYKEGRAISEQEAKLLVPLVRAAHLWLVMFRLVQWREGDPRAVLSIRRSVERRFPALAARAAHLEAAALAVST